MERFCPAQLFVLGKRRADIDDEIARVAGGDIAILDDTSIKDRFQQVTQLARGLLTDCREVEQTSVAWTGRRANRLLCGRVPKDIFW